MKNCIDLSTARVLITGGSEGIGFGLARRFLMAGSSVLVTGRTAAKLERAASDLPGLQTFVNDIGLIDERERLASHVLSTMPGVNIVINNAGIQRRIALAEDNAPWTERQTEIDVLLSAPVHLNHLLIPAILMNGTRGLIANVTSGGAYLPQPFAPVYSACKAALHSYTVNLRFALSGTNVDVVEIIPPAVRTALAGPGSTHGASIEEFCDSVFAALARGEATEVGFGPTASDAFNAPMELYRSMFDQFSGRFPIKTYG